MPLDRRQRGRRPRARRAGRRRPARGSRWRAQHVGAPSAYSERVERLGHRRRTRPSPSRPSVSTRTSSTSRAVCVPNEVRNGATSGSRSRRSSTRSILVTPVTLDARRACGAAGHARPSRARAPIPPRRARAADRAQAVEGGDAERSREVAVGAAADRDGRRRSRPASAASRAASANEIARGPRLQRRPVRAAGDLDPGAGVGAVAATGRRRRGGPARRGSTARTSTASVARAGTVLTVVPALSRDGVTVVPAPASARPATASASRARTPPPRSRPSRVEAGVRGPAVRRRRR